jgi:hypothetical protein
MTDDLTETELMGLKPGLHALGGGLYFRVTDTSAQWVLRYQKHRRRRHMGLGGFPAISLNAARKRATDARALLANGVDPIDVKAKGVVYIVRLPAIDGKRAVFKIGKTLNGFADKRIDELGRALRRKLTTVLIANVDNARHVERQLLALGSAVDLGNVPSRSEYRAFSDSDLIAIGTIVERFKTRPPAVPE